MNRNEIYPKVPYIEVFGGHTALFLRSIALHPSNYVPLLPRNEMSEYEEVCYDVIVTAAREKAEAKNLKMSLSGFEHSDLVDEWLKFNGFTITSNQYLKW